MRRRFLVATALILLAAVAVDAQQPMVGPEIASDPIDLVPGLSSDATPAVRLIADGGGFVLAWSALAGDGYWHAYVGRLDATARLVAGSVRGLAGAPGADAANPSLAAVPGGFVAAWLESTRLLPVTRLMVARLDPQLHSVAPRVLQAVAGGAPVIRTTGSQAIMAAGSSVSTLNADASIAGSVEFGRHADDVAVNSTGGIAAVGHVSTRTQRICWCPSPAPIEEAYIVSLTWFGRAVFTTPTLPRVSTYGAGVASNGKSFLVAWHDATANGGGSALASIVDESLLDAPSFVTPLTIGFVGPDLAGPVARQPQVASDGERYVVVWQDRTGQQRDIVGAVVSPRERTSIPFTVTATDADETQPAIVAVSPGRFLVAYNSVAGGKQRIAGRFVTFVPARHRPSR